MNEGRSKGTSPVRLLAVGAAAGAAALAAVLALSGAAVIGAGLYDPRALTQHDPFSAWAIHGAFVHAVRRMAADETAPASFTRAQIEDGAALYRRNCVTCHGGPGQPRAPWASAINPTPPFLLDSARRWTPAELHMIVADGVKLTAMPAWSLTLSQGQIWDLVAFLESLPGTPPSQYLRGVQTGREAGPEAPAGEPAGAPQ